MAAAAEEATQGLPKKPNSAFPEQPSHIQQIPSKSHSNTLCKTSIIVLLLLAIPLFPSQPPDFISQTLFTEFWEIIHLLFIGIAISYGLFGRRTAQSLTVDSRIGISDDSSSYLSGISNLNSIFDNGYENICGSEDLENYQQFLGNGSALKIRAEEISEGKIVNQAWCSQYSKGKPLVVVSNGKYFVDGNSDFKPLNLPVRSLRSKAVVDDCSSEFKNRNEPRDKIEAKENDNVDDVKVVRVRGVVPVNLEKKFDEVAGTSSIPWRSRSWGMRDGEETSSPTHYRPHSVGEFEFEHLKFPELRNRKMERKMERKRVFKHPHPKVAPVNVEASFNGPNTRPFSIDASSDTGLENDQIHNSDEVEELGKGKRGVESSSSLGKVLSRAKSVRTIKPNRYTKNQKEHNSETDSLENGEEAENRPLNHQNEEFDRVFPMPKPKPTLAEFHNEEKRDLDARNVSEDTENEFEKSSDEDHGKANDSELEGSEVDRKAGEFIAKFREQIRRQKTSSVEGY